MTFDHLLTLGYQIHCMTGGWAADDLRRFAAAFPEPEAVAAEIKLLSAVADRCHVSRTKREFIRAVQAYQAERSEP